MENKRIVKLCMAAMFAALICVATIVIQIPSPIGGFLNFGDCFILVAAWTLGPIYGFAAGAIGSCMADIITGYVVYAPATFVIKGSIAVLASLITKAVSAKKSTPMLVGYISGSVCAELWMIFGYYIYGAFVMGFGLVGAKAELPMNALQGAVGAAAGCVIMHILLRTKAIRPN